MSNIKAMIKQIELAQLFGYKTTCPRCGKTVDEPYKPSICAPLDICPACWAEEQKGKKQPPGSWWFTKKDNAVRFGMIWGR